MRCSKCGTSNPAGNDFCARCGNALTKPCAKCKAENSPTSDFCGKCGAPLASGAGGVVDTSTKAESASGVRLAPEQADASRAIDGERKTVTPLFSDIKDRRVTSARAVAPAPAPTGIAPHAGTGTAWRSAALHCAAVVLGFAAFFTLFFGPHLRAGELLAPGDGAWFYLPAFISRRTIWTTLLQGGYPVAADPQTASWYPLGLALRQIPDPGTLM